MTLCDFAYFAAIMAPTAGRGKFRTICDWGNWIFPFDDLFDDGKYAKDYTQAQAAVDRVLGAFHADPSGNVEDVAASVPIVDFHDQIWRQIRDADCNNTQAMYARAMADYCTGTLDQVKYAACLEQDYSLKQMLEMRRKSVCVAALFALVQFGEDIRLPISVLEEPLIKDIELIGIDLTLMHNDILSYYKEDAEGVPHNLVAVCRRRGLSAQAAIDHVASLIEKRHDDLEQAIRHIAARKEDSNGHLGRYILGIQNVVKANLYWSFRTARFLTQEQKDSILGSGRIDLRD